MTSKGTAHVRLTSENYERVRALAYMRDDSIASTVNSIIDDYYNRGISSEENMYMWKILNIKAKSLREDESSE